MMTITVISQTEAENYPYVPSKAEAALTSKVRKDMADLYRRVRRDNPALARLLYARMRISERSFTRYILFGEPLPE